MIFKPEEIDRGIAVVIEDILAKYGYWPDLNNYLPEPIDQVAFKAELDSIRSTKGVAPIEVFYPNSARDGLEITDGHISIRRNYFSKGQIGFGCSIDIEATIENPATPADQIFRKVKHQETSLDIDYEIRFIAKTGKMHRIIDQMMATAFGARKFIYGVNPDRSKMDDGFEFVLDGLPTEIKGPDTIERMYRYKATDVFITDPEIIVESIKPILSIQVEILPIKDINDLENISDDDFIPIIIESEE